MQETVHPGIRCEDVVEYRQGDEYFKNYMIESGARYCANPSCRMPCIRIDGCYRITCSRCDVSMCFKCPADQMTPYKDMQECYDHLDEVHGDYF